MIQSLKSRVEFYITHTIQLYMTDVSHSVFLIPVLFLGWRSDNINLPDDIFMQKALKDNQYKINISQLLSTAGHGH